MAAHWQEREGREGGGGAQRNRGFGKTGDTVSTAGDADFMASTAVHTGAQEWVVTGGRKRKVSMGAGVTNLRARA